jgi:chromosome segregation ATPase
MKQVTINQLKLMNFKGVRELALDLDGKNADISGRNGSGKTTIADAFNWLLWGKDSQGNSDNTFGIKTTDASGNVIPELEHKVTVTLSVTDTETGETATIELSRCLVEDWREDNGKRVLKGNHTDYTINGAPVGTKREYDRRVSEIIPENVFKLITSPDYFNGLDWEQRRRILIDMAGETSNAEVVAEHPELSQLLDKLAGKDIDDYRRELTAQLKRTDEALDKIPVRIDEVHRSMPKAEDFPAIEQELAQTEDALAKQQAATASLSEAARQQGEQAASMQKEINSLRMAQQRVLYTAKAEAERKAAGANEERNRLAGDLRILRNNATAGAARNAVTIAQLKREAETYQKSITRMKDQQERLRERFRSVNSEQYQREGPLMCPVFKHACQDAQACLKHQADADKAAEDFNTVKLGTLNCINTEGKELGRNIADVEAMKAKSLEAIAKAEAESAATEKESNAQIEALRRQIDARPEQKPSPVDAETLAEWVEAENRIKQLLEDQTKLRATPAPNLDDTHTQQLKSRIDTLKQSLYKRDIIAQAETRIKELESEARKLAQAKATTAEALNSVERFTAAKVDATEARVNAMFHGVHFKMFRTLLNGTRQPDCICYIDGTRWFDKNAAGRVNGGLEIINTLSRHHGVSAPIFIDNAERVNDFIATDGQLIMLTVTRGDFKVKQL